MAWAWLKHAPWGEIAKVAGRVPEFVRDLRRGRDDDEVPPPAAPAGAEAPDDVARLRFEIELLKTHVERLRAHSEQQAQVIETQARQMADGMAELGARARLNGWIAAAALVAAIAAIALVLMR